MFGLKIKDTFVTIPSPHAIYTYIVLIYFYQS